MSNYELLEHTVWVNIINIIIAQRESSFYSDAFTNMFHLHRDS